MLVLTLRQEQGVLIGTDVLVRVLGFRGRHEVRLGITAPQELAITRTESDVGDRHEAERDA